MHVMTMTVAFGMLESLKLLVLDTTVAYMITARQKSSLSSTESGAVHIELINPAL